MGLQITHEERKEIKDEFAFMNDTEISIYANTILEYCKSKVKVSDKAIIEEMFPTLSKIEQVSLDILFVLSTAEPGAKPIQTVAGMIYGFISASDKLRDKTNAMHTAMEILMISEKYVKFEWSKNGFPMINNLISQEDLIMKNIYLPLERPTYQHTELGSFVWKMDNDTDAVESFDTLNHIGMKLVQLKEEPEELPHSTDFSVEGNKQRELYNKQIARAYLAKEYENKSIYFNWSPDYRGRQYSVGYYINPQGNEIEKNMIQFTKGEKLNHIGVQQLKKSIASAYGLDKSIDSEKIAWFEKNRKMLHLRQKSADEPYTFQALVNAWKEHQDGKKVHMPVELDATTSFAQIISVLMGKREIAEKCNVINKKDKTGSVVIADLYGEIANRMSDIMAEQQKKTA